ncbi:MAG TPA: M90 family metallopeptidase [Steroidobacteraceae bacterium]|nr:M90 family metallopeptidase [Steroidobacteraceae bacterium]
MFLFLLLITAGLGTAAWLAIEPRIKRKRRERWQNESFPSSWDRILTDRVAFYRWLPPGLRTRLQGLIQVFMHEKTFVGCNELVVTDEMRVIIAAHACLLVINRPRVPAEGLYDDLFSLLVYPSPFVVAETRAIGHGLVTEGRRVLSGQAWDSRRILLSWDDVQQAEFGGHNVVLHEFAHYLDMEDEVMDGAPGLNSKRAYQDWSRVFWNEFGQLRAAIYSGQPTIIDPYAATSPAEFFAVVTETFFQKPHELATAHAALYAQLQKYFRVDPTTWVPRPEPPIDGGA